ncbi:MAG: ABC transporter ATP-binding protein [Bacteroidales bacterium]|nr:ABC transporter ATP-binding protein [Bacteroidales bacterium]
MIRLTNISKSYDGLQVLKDISLEINDGEIVSISGNSGAGKTTLLNIMGTLDRADSGEIIIDGKDVSKFPDKELSLFRNQKIGFVFQFHNLLPEFTAMENAILPSLIYSFDNKAAKQRAEELFSVLGISSKSANYPSELSGGEQQRVAIVRALINSPSLVLADEPTGNLDSQNAESLFNLFFLLRKNFNHTFVIVTHDKAFAGRCDRELIISDGKIIQ